MKKSWRIVLFAWYFLLQGKSGTVTPSIFMVIGPFDSQANCEDIKNQLIQKVEKVWGCWEGTRS